MNTIVTGLQWGDEGKGKIVDYLTETADVVVRGQGGNNAGHTVIARGTKYILHLLPSGILWDGKINVIGNGVVVDPVGLVAEIERVEGQGVSITPEKLLISDRAHVVLPLHKELDAAREAALGDRKIGTTKRGIGPTYADKINRCGLRVADLLNEAYFREMVAHRTADANEVLAKFGLPTFNAEQQADEVLAAFARLRPHVTNTIPVLHKAWKEGKIILFEGAQGSLLDIDFGTYPFVTRRIPLPVVPAPAAACRRQRSSKSSASARLTRPASVRDPSPPSMKDCPSICTTSAANSVPPPAARAAADGSMPSCSATAAWSTARPASP